MASETVTLSRAQALQVDAIIISEELRLLAFHATAEIEVLVALARRETEEQVEEPDLEVALTSLLKRIRRLNSVVMSVASGEDRDFIEMYREVHDQRPESGGSK